MAAVTGVSTSQCGHLGIRPPLRFRPRWWAGVLAICLALTQAGWAGSEKSSAPLTTSNGAKSALLTYADEANFGTTQPSNEVRQIANAILRARDQAGQDFFIIDKKNAKLYAFTSAGSLRGQTAILLGSARGDDSVPGIGTRPISQVRPEERTTPAGRFVAERGHNSAGEDIVWIDYDTALSMHRVRAQVVKERRQQRLATPTSQDNRISYGCVNIPKQFYEAIVARTFEQAKAVVYILPEVKSLQQVFSFDVSTK